ncbi:MAG: hypothetical protein ABIK89_11815, partial [Planctomycetota bacterium]
MRLHAPGVLPLHCLILRGAAATVVRRWSPDTRLNGRDFSDGDLVPGDRLSVGPIELEVVESNRAPSMPVGTRPVNRLQAGLKAEKEALAEKIGQWKAEQAEAEARLESHNRQLDTRQARLEALERDRIAQLDARHAEIEARQAELEAQESRARQLDARRAELEALEREHTEQLEARQAELEALEKEKTEQFEARQAELEAQLKERAEQLNARQAKLEALEKGKTEQLASRQVELEALEKEKTEQFEARQAELEAQLKERAERLNARQAKLEALEKGKTEQLASRRAELEALERKHAEQLEARQAELEALEREKAEQFEARQAELEAKERALDEERSRWRSEQAGTDSELTTLLKQRETAKAELEALEKEKAEQLTARLAEVEAKERTFEEQREQWESERAAIDKRLNDQGDELAAQLAELEAQRESFRQERDERESKPAELESATEQPSTVPEQPEALSFQPVSEAAPVDTAEILRRMGAVPLLPDDEEEEAPSEPEPNRSKPLEVSKATLEPAANEHDTDENDTESIDDYMSKLLDRVRSVTGETTQPTPTRKGTDRNVRSGEAGSGSDQVEQDGLSDNPAVAPAAARKRSPVEMPPRATAPEKSVNLSAMRELANMSARTAIDRHSQRQLSKSRLGKLAVTLVALAVGTGLLWLWWTERANPITLGGALTCLIVALFWGSQYIWLLGRKLLNKVNHVNWSRERDLPSEEAQEADEHDPQQALDEMESTLTAGLLGLDSAT